MIVTFVFCITDIEKMINDSTSCFPYVGVFQAAIGSTAGATTMMALLVALTCATCLSTLAAASRQAWPFGRDEGLPFSSWFRKVNTLNDVGRNANLMSSTDNYAGSSDPSECDLVFMNHHDRPLVHQSRQHGRFQQHSRPPGWLRRLRILYLNWLCSSKADPRRGTSSRPMAIREASYPGQRLRVMLHCVLHGLQLLPAFRDALLNAGLYELGKCDVRRSYCDFDWLLLRAWKEGLQRPRYVHQ